MATPFNLWGALDRPPTGFNAQNEDPQPSPTQSYDASQGPVDLSAIMGVDRSPAGTKKKKSVPAPAPVASPSPRATPEAAAAAIQGAQQPQPPKQNLNMFYDASGRPMMFDEQGRLAMVDKGSGLSDEYKTRTQTTSKDVTRDARSIDPAEYAQAHENIESLPEFQRQKSGLDNMQEMLNAQVQNQKPQVDYSPLMSLIDSFTGSKFAENYKRPMTGDQQFQKAFESAQQIQKDRAAMSKNISDLIKPQFGGYASSQDQLLDEAARRLGAKDPAASVRQMPVESRAIQLSRQVERDMKDVKGADTSLREAQRLLASGTSVNDTTFRDKFLKALIGGRLTNYDLVSQAGDTSLGGRIDGAISKLKNGNLSDLSRKEYEDALRVLSEGHQEEGNLRLGHWREVGTHSYNIPPEMVEPIVSGFNVGGRVSQPVLNRSKARSQAHVDAPAAPAGSGPVKNSGPGGAMSYEEFQKSRKATQ